MRIVSTALVTLLAFGCGGKKDPNAGAGSGSGPAKTDSGSGSAAQAVGSGSAGSGSGEGPTVLVLPRLEGDEVGKAPHKTTKPMDQAAMQKLADGFKYIGFNQEVRGISDNSLDVRYVTDSRPRLAVVVKIWHCAPDLAADLKCDPLTLDEWSKKKVSLLTEMKGGLATEPSTVVEIGDVDVGGGAKAISTYTLGFNVGKSEQGAGAYSDTYKLHWHDGVNRIQVAAEYKDDPTATMQDMLNLAPKEDLAKIAKSFFDVYTHAWDK